MDYQKKSSNTPIIIFIFFIILMVGAVLFIKYKNNKVTDQPKKKEVIAKINREIEYTDEKYIYDIIQDNDNFEIIIKAPDECETKPCSSSKVDSYNVTNENEKKDLKELFDKFFEKANQKKLELSRKDISIDDYTILKSVFREPEKDGKVTYKILNNTDNSGIINTGYKISKSENKYLLTIALGEKSTGGYSIEITKIIVNNDVLDIHIKEITPNRDSVVTQAFTTPAIIIELSALPETIHIIDSNNYLFQELTDDQVKKPEEPEEKKPTENENYKVLESTNNSSYKLRGYYINGNTITIASGSRNTGGYTIEVTDIVYTDTEVKITVKENIPPKDATTIQAITYPIVKIEFKQIPSKITVVDEKNNQLKEIK